MSPSNNMIFFQRSLKYLEIVHLKSNKLPASIEAILFGMLISRIGFFSLTPFFPLLLLGEYGFSIKSTGEVLGAIALLAAILGIVSGPLSDSRGAGMVMKVGLLISVAGALGLLFRESKIAFFVAISAFTAGKAVTENALKAYLAQINETPAAYEEAIHYRYFYNNLGALLGPLLFAIAGVSGSWLVASFAAIAYTFFLFIFLKVNTGFAQTHVPIARTPHVLHRKLSSKLISSLLRDWRLAICVLHGIFLFYVTSQMTVTLPQYFAVKDKGSAAFMTSLVIMLNAVSIVVLHPMYNKIRTSLTPFSQAAFGGLCISASQLLVALWIADSHHVAEKLAIATVVFTVGELFLFPLYSVLLNKIAPQDLRGAYFGLGSLYLLGAAAGPVCGAYLLSSHGPTFVFLISALVGIISLLLAISLVRSLSTA